MSTKRQTRWYGWIPDLPHPDDARYSAPRAVLRALPPTVDLRPFLPKCYDQGPLGSCTGNGHGAAHQLQQVCQSLPRGTKDAATIAAAVKKSFIPSRLAIYFDERSIEGTVNEDSGAMIRDGIKVMIKNGVAPEKLWPYKIGKFRDKPPEAYYQEAQKHQVIRAERVPQTRDQMKACLAEGNAIVLGFSVFESFETRDVSQTGLVPIPRRGEKLFGGHCVLHVGYTNDIRSVHSQGKRLKLPAWAESVEEWDIHRNSWGIDWGDVGHFYTPAGFMDNNSIADDLWRVLIVEQ